MKGKGGEERCKKFSSNFMYGGKGKCAQTTFEDEREWQKKGKKKS
jgi:hypothetical protein